MKNFKSALFFVLIFFPFACSQNHNEHQKEDTGQPNDQMMADHDHSKHAMDQATEKPKAKSRKQAAMAMMDGNHIHVDYSSPRVRGRQIFGGLVAYDEVWVTGAHRATAITFDKDVMIENNHIPKGKYGFFTIPSESEWTVILNKEWDMHLADDYNSSEDIFRFKVTPEKLNSPSEELTYKVEVENGTAQVSMAWSDMKISFPLKNHSK